MKSLEATVRNDGIRVKVSRTGTFEQALCEVVASLLPDCYGVMNISLPSLVKQTCKSALQATLIGCDKWEPVRLPKPTQVGTDSLR